MNIFPITKTLPIFNSDDYETTEEKDSESADVDLTNYVKKTGDSMTGQLHVFNGIRFADSSTQHSSFTNEYKNELDTLINADLDMFENSTITTNNLFLNDSIVFDDGIQENAFTPELKTKLDTLEHMTDDIRLSSSAYVIIDKTLSLKNSYTKNIINTISPFTLLDGNLALMRGSNEYRKYWLGMTGNDVDALDNRFNICVNGNDDLPECILDLDHEGSLIIKGNMTCPDIITQMTTYSDGVQNNAFTIAHKAKLDSLQSDTADITQNINDISQNAFDIAQNTSDIVQNTSDIVQNTSSISQNATVISQNASDITQNAAVISQNSALISNHDTDILNLENATQFSLLTQTWKDEIRKQSTIFETVSCYCGDVFGTNAGPSFPLNSTIISNTELDMSTLVPSIFYNGGFAYPLGWYPPVLMHMKFEVNMNIADGYVKKCMSRIYVKNSTGSTIAHSLLQGVEYPTYQNRTIAYSCDLRCFLRDGDTVTVSTHCDIVSYASNFEMEGQFSFVQL